MDVSSFDEIAADWDDRPESRRRIEVEFNEPGVGITRKVWRP